MLKLFNLSTSIYLYQSLLISISICVIRIKIRITRIISFNFYTTFTQLLYNFLHHLSPKFAIINQCFLPISLLPTFAIKIAVFVLHTIDGNSIKKFLSYQVFLFIIGLT